MTKPADLTTEIIKAELKKRKLRIVHIAEFGNLNHRYIYTLLKKGEPNDQMKYMFYLVFQLFDLSEEFREQVKK